MRKRVNLGCGDISEEDADRISLLSRQLLYICHRYIEDDVGSINVVNNSLMTAWINFIRDHNMEHETAAILPSLCKHLLDCGAEKMENTSQH